MEKEPIEMYAIVELFGHQRIAGLVTEATIGGCSFVRVDIPGDLVSQPITKFYGNGAIYCMTPVSREVVETYLKRYRPAPLNVWMPEIKQLSVDRGDGEYPEDMG